MAGNRSGLEIDATVVERATKTVEFFERHAQRLYGLPANPNVALAKRVLKKLRQGDGSAMTVRELYRHLGVKLEQGQTALALLEKSGYIRTWTEQHERGGQPKRLVVINPKLLDVPELS